MITFLKIPPYELRPEGREVYEYVCAVASGEENPPSETPHALSLPGKTVFHSTLHRASGALAAETESIFIPTNELDEIRFEMRRMVSKAAWEAEGSRAVRRAFVDAFITSTLPQETQRIIEDAQILLKKVARIKKEAPTVVLSHSFRLKVIEAYIRSRGKLREEYSLLRDFLPIGEKTYPFLGGFEASRMDIEHALSPSVKE